MKATVAQRRLVAQGVVGGSRGWHGVAGGRSGRAMGTPAGGADAVASAAARQLATQAQDFHGAKWALGLRAGTDEAGVDAALATGAVVRTWPMRGTLMFLARDDARWVTELLAPRSYGPSAGIWRAAGLAESDFERAAAVARDVLAGGRALSRQDLQAAMQAAGVETAASRGSLILRRIAGDGVIVFGPPRGSTQTFALLGEWIPGSRRLERDDALRELAVRYVGGHGPATVHDLAWWSGLTLTETRRAVALADDELERCEIAGVEMLTSHQDPDAHQTAQSGDIRLVPGFDEMLLGYRDRSASLESDHASLVAPSSNGRFLPTVLVDGRAVATWTLDRGEVVVTPFPGAPEPPAEALAARVAEYGRYLGKPARWRTVVA